MAGEGVSRLAVNQGIVGQEIAVPPAATPAGGRRFLDSFRSWFERVEDQGLPLLCSRSFLDEILLYRSIWLTGPLGCGKSFLAVGLARQLQLLYGYNVYANIPVSFADVVPSVIPEHSVLVLDEAADWLDAYDWRSSLIRRFRYLRHLDLVVLISSSDPVHKRLRKMSCRVRRIRVPLGGGFWCFVRTWYDDQMSPPGPRSTRLTKIFFVWATGGIHRWYPSKLSARIRRYDDEILAGLVRAVGPIMSGPVEEWGRE
jgi:hypothetical protein